MIVVPVTLTEEARVSLLLIYFVELAAKSSKDAVRPSRATVKTALRELYEQRIQCGCMFYFFFIEQWSCFF